MSKKKYPVFAEYTIVIRIPYFKFLSKAQKAVSYIKI